MTYGNIILLSCKIRGFPCPTVLIRVPKSESVFICVNLSGWRRPDGPVRLSRVCG